VPNRLKLGDEMAGVAPGHGKSGYVFVSITIPRQLKTALVKRAVADERYQSEVVRDALEAYLSVRSAA
jgi:hypothetical protein